ncbi:17835_t:CDS:2, partial [Racocetra fulgida]
FAEIFDAQVMLGALLVVIIHCIERFRGFAKIFGAQVMLGALLVVIIHCIERFRGFAEIFGAPSSTLLCELFAIDNIDVLDEARVYGAQELTSDIGNQNDAVLDALKLIVYLREDEDDEIKNMTE